MKSVFLLLGKPLISSRLKDLIASYDSKLDFESAKMPPNEWYYSPEFDQLERQCVFNNNWIHVGRMDQIQEDGGYITGTLGNEPYLVIRNNKEIKALSNICRHRASCLLDQKNGKLEGESIVCPYHGWSYTRNGKLSKALQLTGIKNFSAREHRLPEFGVIGVGPLIYLNTSGSNNIEFINEMEQLMHQLDIYDVNNNIKMKHVASKTYSIKCNWKVYSDNYLDGGYHVSRLHPQLNELLDMKTYKLDIFRNYCIQSCQSVNSNNRVGSDAKYVYVFPNLMINRYGKWMDTNTIYPTGPESCEVHFDWYLDNNEFNKKTKISIDEELEASKLVQDQDTSICENVQKGLNSNLYRPGRYTAPEKADYWFHGLLHQQTSAYII